MSALAAFTGLQAFWISRALDRVHATLDRLELKFDQVSEPIAGLEATRPD
jgi:hypothetical protein